MKGGLMTSAKNLTELVDPVIGVDTHEQSPVAAAIDAVTCGILDTIKTPTDPADHPQPIDWANQHPRNHGWAIEGTNSHGIGLTPTPAGAVGSRSRPANQDQTPKRREIRCHRHGPRRWSPKHRSYVPAVTTTR